MSPRETKAEKAVRMIAERRLMVERVAGQLVVASCRGDSGSVYALGYDPTKREWRCTCPASREFHSTDCAHLLALKLVVSI
jgi:hypothetical protein